MVKLASSDSTRKRLAELNISTTTSDGSTPSAAAIALV
jgi:hypothetical protein